MVKLVSWNIDRREKPWRELLRMAEAGDADVALLQEAGTPPSDIAGSFDYDGSVCWDQTLYDRWPLVVKLSDRVTIKPYRQVHPISDLGVDKIGVSGIGTIAAARVTEGDSEESAFIAISIYSRWLRVHPSTKSSWIVADASAHRILSDLSAFIGHRDPAKHRILAAGDLNMFYGATGRRLSLPERERTVWDRMDALGLEFLGPQAPNGRTADCTPTDVPSDTDNVPTYHPKKGSPETACDQLDYAFASRGFHECVHVQAMNELDEWGSSDHCRLMIKVRTITAVG